MSKKTNENAVFWIQIRQAERNIIEYTLQQVPSIRRAAATLGVSANFLAKRIRKLGVKLPPEIAEKVEVKAKMRAAKEAAKPKKRGRPVGSKNKPATGEPKPKAPKPPRTLPVVAVPAKPPHPTDAAHEEMLAAARAREVAFDSDHDLDEDNLGDADDLIPPWDVAPVVDDDDDDDDEEPPDAGPTVN